MPCAAQRSCRRIDSRVPADAARLDVDDPAGARARSPPPRRGPCGSTRRGRSASRSAAAARVVADVVVLERLLDHHQVEPIERGEVRGVAERVGGVGVDHQRNGAEPRADRLDRGDVPAGLDLDLDAAVAGGQLRSRPCAASCSSESWMPIDTPDGDLASRVPPSSRDSGTPCCRAREIPRRHLDRGLRHVVAADARERRKDLARMLERAAEHERREEVLDDVPRASTFVSDAVVRIRRRRRTRRAPRRRRRRA